MQHGNMVRCIMTVTALIASACDGVDEGQDLEEAVELGEVSRQRLRVLSVVVGGHTRPMRAYGRL